MMCEGEGKGGCDPKNTLAAFASRAARSDGAPETIEAFVSKSSAPTSPSRMHVQTRMTVNHETIAQRLSFTRHVALRSTQRFNRVRSSARWCRSEARAASVFHDHSHSPVSHSTQRFNWVRSSARWCRSEARAASVFHDHSHSYVSQHPAGKKRLLKRQNDFAMIRSEVQILCRFFFIRRQGDFRLCYLKM